jgi:hypothetical protein
VAVYGIRVAGQIDTQWSAWLDGLTITHPHPGEAMISGEIVDQAALHGTLNRIRNLNLPIISVVQIDPDPLGPDRSSDPVESVHPSHTAEEGHSNVQHHPRT